MFDLLRELIAPSKPKSIFRQDAAGRSNVRRVLTGIVTCFVVTALLSSNRLVAMAERMEYGESRDRWLGAAEAVDGIADALRLDRPSHAVDEALGRSSTESTVVLGELALAVTTTTAPPLTTPPPVAAAPPRSTTIVGRTTTTDAPATTTEAPTTTTTVEMFGTVDVNHPLRVWAGGDSLGEFVGSRLQYKIVADELTDVELDYQISTGLARPDYFDWPARMSEVMQRGPELRPQVVVFMVGGNDDQDMRTGDGRLPFFDDAWLSEYRSRIALMMDTTAYPGTQMIWINLPPMRGERRDQMVSPINAILEEEASVRPWVSVADIVPTFSADGGGYEQFLTEPGGDKTIQARANDGVHITSSASEWVARLVWGQVQQSWTFDVGVAPTTTTPGPAEPNDGGDDTGIVPPGSDAGADESTTGTTTAASG